MDVVFSIQNYAIIKVLPVVPPNIEIKRSDKSEVFDSIQLGEMELMGGKGSRKLTIRSFFPNKQYEYVRPKASCVAMEYVRFFQAVWDAQIPVKVSKTLNDGTILLNTPMKIKTFDYYADQAGDIAYTLSFVEYKFVKV